MTARHCDHCLSFECATSTDKHVLQAKIKAHSWLSDVVGGSTHREGGRDYQIPMKAHFKFAEMISGILLCDATRCKVHARFGMLLLLFLLPPALSPLSLTPSISLLLSLHDNDNDSWPSWLPPKLKRLQRKKCLAYAMACLFAGFVAHFKSAARAARGV